MEIHLTIRPVNNRSKTNLEAIVSSFDLEAFHNLLITWGNEHFRPFPWRFTENPYFVLISEVMLHRTKALQVVSVYEQFIQRYPDISSLASATKNELHEILYSLGLRWRIDLIHAMASDLKVRFAEQIPKRKVDLLSLPGVSDYIASAVRCFAWNLPEALIDTNTVRVIGRLFGLEIKDSSRRNSTFKRLIETLVDPSEPRIYNYALLDLADRVCTKRRIPDCLHCPVLAHCLHGAGVLAKQATDESI